MTSGDNEVQVLVEELSAQLGRSVLVDDASLRLVAYSPTYGTEDEVRRTAILTRETPRAIRDLHFSQGIATASRPVRTAAKPELGLESRVCVPIRCQGTLFGYLWLIDADDSLTRDDRVHAERCAGDIGAAMYRLQELEKPRRELEQRLVEALLEGDAGERAEAAHELLAADMLLPGTGVAAVVVRTGDEDLSSAQKARLSLTLDQFRAALPIRHGLSLVRSDHGIVLLAADPAMRRAGGVAKLARRLHDSLERTSGDEIALGFSDECEHLQDAHRAYAHARIAARVASCVPEHSPVAGWEALGPYRVLAQLAPGAATEELLHPGLPRLFDLHAKESLVTTLETYLDHGCDTKLTAEELFLHRASLYYRLQRIEELTGASLKSGADRLALHLSLKLAWLLGVHPGQRRR
ncbi:MAG TPA: helix-turn-helix domain-containing protein [Solirubrobacteraceae bacterium]|nr:helix-turn-helix domain-containing protein [Solirubrobacteraceae bacterium]